MRLPWGGEEGAGRAGADGRRAAEDPRRGGIRDGMEGAGGGGGEEGAGGSGDGLRRKEGPHQSLLRGAGAA